MTIKGGGAHCSILAAAVMVALIAAPALGASASQPSAAGRGSIDGKVFAGKIGEKGKAAGDPDEFFFKDGTFRSAGCDRYGFTATRYKAFADGDTTRFAAEAVSEKEGKMVWNGVVHGDRIEGTAVWNKPGQPLGEYWFKATLKK